MFSKYRTIMITVTAIMLLLVASMTRFSDATAKTIAYAMELTQKGQFHDAVKVLQRAKRTAKKNGQDTLVKRLDKAFDDVAAEKKSFKRLDAVLGTAENLTRRFMFPYAADLLEQVQEAELSASDAARVQAAITDIHAREAKHDPAAGIVTRARLLVKAGDAAGAITLLEGARVAARKDRQVVAEDALRRELHNIQEQIAPPASVPASSNSHSSSGEATGIDGGSNVSHVTSESPSGLSGATRSHSGQGQDKRSFKEKVSDKLQHMLGTDETHALECVRD